MSKLLEEILSDENVELALEKVKAKKGKSGIDGITVKEIDAMLDPHNYVGLAPEFVDRVVAKYSKN